MSLGYGAYSAKLESSRKGEKSTPKAIAIERWEQRDHSGNYYNNEQPARKKKIYIPRTEVFILRTFLGANRYIGTILKKCKLMHQLESKKQILCKRKLLATSRLKIGIRTRLCIFSL